MQQTIPSANRYLRYIQTGHSGAVLQLKYEYLQLITPFLKIWRDRPMIFLCIGSDRVTGDSLGPITGYRLQKLAGLYPNVHVYGTLDHPVHALNLAETLKEIHSRHHRPVITAIDACLGRASNVGCLQIGTGPISPGSALKKTLPDVGDLFITGIVNFNHFMDMAVLQNTRLSLVMKMADLIYGGILCSLMQLPVQEQSKK